MELEEYHRIAEAQESHWWYQAMGQLLRQEFGRYLDGGTVLDVGAGPGAHSAWLREHASPIAIDFEPVAMQLHRQRHPNTPVVVGDVNCLPIASGTADGVLCVGVIVHRSVPSPAAAVAEMARVLRPGGVLCILEAGVRRLRRPHDRITHTGRRFSLAELRSFAVSAGLTVERATGSFSFLVPPAAALAVLDRTRQSAQSDVDRSPDGLGGVLPRLAQAERAVLRRTPLPAGLSVMMAARKPA